MKKKKTQKKLQLSAETLTRLDLEGVKGGLTSFWSCPEDPVTKAFTDCSYCPSYDTCQLTNCRDYEATYLY